jgi:hypothetical protein
MKVLFCFGAVLLAAMIPSCATEQGYTTTTTTDTTTHSDAVRTAGSSASMPSNGPSMMSGGPR